MINKTCTQCLHDMIDCSMRGFISNFRLLQNGLVHFDVTRKYHEIEELDIEEVKTCVNCRTSTYLIRIGEHKGLATEFWNC